MNSEITVRVVRSHRIACLPPPASGEWSGRGTVTAREAGAVPEACAVRGRDSFGLWTVPAPRVLLAVAVRRTKRQEEREKCRTPAVAALCALFTPPSAPGRASDTHWSEFTEAHGCFSSAFFRASIFSLASATGSSVQMPSSIRLARRGPSGVMVTHIT